MILTILSNRKYKIIGNFNDSYSSIPVLKFKNPSKNVFYKYMEKTVE